METTIIVIIRHIIGRDRLLQRAINTVMHQTHRPADVCILLTDPAPDENSVSALASHLQPGVRILQGNSQLREALADSQASRIAFLDDDDSWAPELLSRLTSLLTRQKNRHASIRGIACHVNKVDEIAEGNRIIINTTHPWNHHLSEGPVNLDTIYYKNSIPISSCLFDKNAVSDLLQEHDATSPSFYWPFLIHFLGRHDLWMVAEPMAFYHFRQDDDQRSGNFTVIHQDRSELEFTFAMHTLLRNNTEKLTAMLLEALLNKTQFHRIAGIEHSLKGK